MRDSARGCVPVCVCDSVCDAVSSQPGSGVRSNMSESLGASAKARGYTGASAKRGADVASSPMSCGRRTAYRKVGMTSFPAIDPESQVWRVHE